MKEKYDKIIQASAESPHGALQRLDLPWNPNNGIDSLGYYHNVGINIIIANLPSKPTLSDVYNSYVNSPHRSPNETNVITSLAELKADIDKGFQTVFVLQNGIYQLDTEAYYQPESSETVNDINVQFFNTVYATSDYSVRRQLALTTENDVASSKTLTNTEKGDILKMVGLFKWSDYFWTNVYSGPLPSKYPNPAFWDVAWIKLGTEYCDCSHGSDPGGVYCFTRLISGTKAFSATMAYGI